MKFPIEEIWIDVDAENEPWTRKIVSKLPLAKIRRGGALEEAEAKLLLEEDPFSTGKRILRLKRYKGAFIKPCPGTPEYVCCGLQILNIGQGCPMDCRYCALQAYFNRPTLEVFVNIEDLVHSLDHHLKSDPNRIHRICTGEFTDSLALNFVTDTVPMLVEYFSRQRRAFLEIKTKTNSVEPLLEVNPEGQVIVGFSLNSKHINQSEEIGSASLDNRLKAARKLVDRGYLVSFHFDPIIPHDNWERQYSDIIEKIFQLISADSVAWISLGVIRFTPSLKETASERFGTVPFYHKGFIRGLDGKYRLFRDQRIEIYSFIAENIKNAAPEIPLYLCMESPEVWSRSLGMKMESDDDLSNYLDHAACNK